MARGGARPGAGRKAGSATAKTRQVADAAAATGITPLEFMLARMRDESAPIADRMDMAKSAAPFIHPKLSSVEANLNADISLRPSVVEFVAPQVDGKG